MPDPWPAWLPMDLPKVPARGDLAWCSYPATPPAANCLRWRKGEAKAPADCADCIFCRPLPPPPEGA